MNDDAPETPADSPHRIAPEAWSQLVTDLKADKPPKKSRARGARSKPLAELEYSQSGSRNAWEIALEIAGRLGRDLGDGKFAILCINDAAHSNPDVSAENAGGSCVLLPPAQDSMFGLPKCSHAHCQNLTLRQWIAAVGFETWAEAMLRARGWRRAREFLLHDTGISGWKKIPFLLRDQQDTVDGGPVQIVPDDTEYSINFTARIVGDVKEHEVTTTRRWYEVEAIVSGQTHRFRVAAQDFNALSWVANELGAEAIINTGRETMQKLRAGIQLLSMPVPRRDIYTMIGWRQIAGAPVYLHAGGGIGANGPVEGMSVSLAGDVLGKFSLPRPLEGKALKNAVQACARLFSLGVPEVSIPLFGAVWRAPLGPSPLSVYLSAPPATGKSMLAALAQQHFGAGLHEGALPASVKHSTSASVNALRALVGDALFVLDDFMVSGNMAEDLKLNEKVDSVVRAQYGGTGAQRLSRDGSLSTNNAAAPRSTLVITGETLPRGNSLRSRLLVLELPGRLAEDLDPIKTAAAKGVYAGAMSAFIQWLAPQLETIRAQMQRDVLEYAARVREKIGEEDRDRRTALLLAEVMVGIQTFLRFAVETEAMIPGDAEPLRQLAWATVPSIAAQQRAHRAQQDPVLRFLELIGAALGAGRCHVSLDDGTAPELATAWGWRVASSTPEGDSEEPAQDLPFDDHPASGSVGERPARQRPHKGMGDCMGIVHVREGLIWIKPEIAMKVARELAAALGDPLSLTAEDMPRRLFERGLLAKDDFKTNRTYVVRGPKEAAFKRGYLCLSTKSLGLGETDPLSAAE